MRSLSLRLAVVSVVGSVVLVACGKAESVDGGGDGSAGEASGGSTSKGGRENSGGTGTATGGNSNAGQPGDAGAGGEGASGGSGGASGSAGSSGASGTAGTAGSPPNEDVADAIRLCAWTTGCLNTEDDAGGAAPNSSFSACFETFAVEHAGNTRYPWGEVRDCIDEEPTACADFVACLERMAAICPVAASDPPDWTRPNHCADGTRRCEPCAPAVCDGFSATCTDDGAGYLQCFDAVQSLYACDPEWGSCLEFSGTAVCVRGEVGSCSGSMPPACDGTFAVFCADEVEVRYDCAALGKNCTGGMGCTSGDACTFTMAESCDGEILHACLSGNAVDVDCAALGGNCRTTRSGRDGCVFD